MVFTKKPVEKYFTVIESELPAYEFYDFKNIEYRLPDADSLCEVMSKLEKRVPTLIGRTEINLYIKLYTVWMKK